MGVLSDQDRLCASAARRMTKSCPLCSSYSIGNGDGAAVRAVCSTDPEIPAVRDRDCWPSKFGGRSALAPPVDQLEVCNGNAR